jgi:hypothetical protein
MLTETLLVMAGLMLFTVGQWILADQTAPFFRSLEFHTQHEWVGRITCAIAQLGIIGFYLAEGATTQWGAALFVAYILHDTVHMLLYERDVTSYLHHIVAATVVGLMKLAMTPEQAASVALAGAIVESTGPVLHATWLAKQAGYGSHSLFKAGAGFAALFFGVVRCGIFPWVMAKKMDRVTALVVTPFLILNFYWFWKIIKMLKKALETKEEGASSSAQSHEA